MSAYTSTLGGERHRFDSLARLLAAASPERSGDRLAGLAASSAQERGAARWALAGGPLATFL
ncbi:ethanolamine ammonia-lyase subunit EutB, partial [Streptomyces sp. NL15-2K]|uniref:ethanolamine ammonia-lyase subunit EutB n=1 Tax=Streptomyces sp. NL15-2K TaxID=376149 RepID=UPI00209BC4BF